MNSVLARASILTVASIVIFDRNELIRVFRFSEPRVLFRINLNATHYRVSVKRDAHAFTLSHVSSIRTAGRRVRVHACVQAYDGAPSYEAEDGIAQTSRHDTVLAQSLISPLRTRP